MGKALGKKSPSEPREIICIPGKRADRHWQRKEERCPCPWELAGSFLSAHFTEHCGELNTVSTSNSEAEGAETTEQLTFGDGCETLIKSRVSSIMWEGGTAEKCMRE